MNWAWVWWLAIALLLGAVEMFTLDFTFLMLAAGAVVAIVPAAIGTPVWVQVLVFAFASVFMLVGVRPIALRHVRHSTGKGTTNVDSYIGEAGVVVHAVDERGGRVKFRGEVWSARAAFEGLTLGVGEEIVVTAIDGATAVVARKEATTPPGPGPLPYQAPPGPGPMPYQ